MSAFISQDPAFQERKRTPPNKRRKVTGIGVIVGVVFLLVAGGIFFFVSRTTTMTGDCAEARSMSRDRVEMAKVDCSSPKAAYRQAFYASGANARCPDGDYYAQRNSGSRKDKRISYSCFMLHVREGECLKPTSFGKVSLFEKVACGTGAVKVAKVVTGKVDQSLCGGAGEPRVYREPATTVCLGGA